MNCERDEKSIDDKEEEKMYKTCGILVREIKRFDNSFWIYETHVC